MGDPMRLTKEQEILIILAEECAEVAQECSKGLRFPGDGRVSALTKEIGDLMAMIDYAIEAELIDSSMVLGYKDMKKEKLQEFSEHLGH